jgi:hypothetical protein
MLINIIHRFKSLFLPFINNSINKIYLWLGKDKGLWHIAETGFIYIDDKYNINKCSNNGGIYLEVFNGVMPIDIPNDKGLKEILTSYKLMEELKN